jgi:hypothetical protein
MMDHQVLLRKGKIGFVFTSLVFKVSREAPRVGGGGVRELTEVNLIKQMFESTSI